MEILSQTTVNVLSTIILGALGLVLVQIFTFLRSKTSLIQDEGARNIVNDTLNKVEKLINTNIIAVDNVSKPLIVKAIKDGKVEKSELSKLAIEVKENVLKQMGQDSIDLLNSKLGDVDDFIAKKIEEQLHVLKLDNTTPVSRTRL